MGIRDAGKYKLWSLLLLSFCPQTCIGCISPVPASLTHRAPSPHRPSSKKITMITVLLSR